MTRSETETIRRLVERGYTVRQVIIGQREGLTRAYQISYTITEEDA